MINSEYQELVGFLGRKFEGVDRKLEGTATTEELRTHEANIRRHFDVMAEGLWGQVQLLAEGHQALVEGQERILSRVERMERELGAIIRISYAD